jgi:hypothetical protein
LLFLLGAALIVIVVGRALNQAPGSADIPPTVNPTLKARMAAWAQQSIVYSCAGGEQIIYLGTVTPIADQYAGYTLWRNIPAGAKTDDLLDPTYSEAIKTEIRKIADPGQYRAMIAAVLVNYTIPDWNIIDWVHQMQLQGYVEALCWSFRNQDLLNKTWQLNPDQQATLLGGLAFISAIRGNSADETLALYKMFNVELNPVTIKSAHWLVQPWTQQDPVSCQMLDFINYLSGKSDKGIVFSPGEPARLLIQPGGLPYQVMKCTSGVSS